MIASSLIAGALLHFGVSIGGVFLITGIANAIVAGYIFCLVPEYLLRFVAFVLTRTVYRFRIQGDANIPATGAAIVVCNHVSFVDPVLLMAASPRPDPLPDGRAHLPHAGAGPVLPPRQGDSRSRPRTRTRPPTRRRSRRPTRCWPRATCWASSRKAASPTTARSSRSRAA